MRTAITDLQFELDLREALLQQRPLRDLAPILVEALSSKSKAKRLTAQRFLQLHPEWSLWKDYLEPWLRSQTHWPWPILIPWLTLQRLTIALDERDQLRKIWIHQRATFEVAKHAQWSIVFPELDQWRTEHRLEMQRRIHEIRDLLFEELKTWKSQRLREQEQKVLKRLIKKFPNDAEVKHEWNNFRENQAFETLHEKLRERRNRAPVPRFEDEMVELPEDWRESLQNMGDENIQSFYDLSILCCFCEDWVWALHLANQAEPSQARDWLELEILLKLKRYVDVLQALLVIETKWSAEAETFFATAYARAQAFYGLGQRQRALDVLESLLASRPLYRQGAELLSIWRNPA